ncbi:MAG: nucleotide sugar dehydrogenase [Gammaproteobacteria bacterium]|jgi:UDP-N-acetyl-D-galactosamine dehydrogenase
MVKNRTISVIGLGYVGLPLAVAFGQKCHVIGFDINRVRIDQLSKNIDETGEVDAEELKTADIHFTSTMTDLKQADFHIIAVPTPIDKAKQPNLNILLRASAIVGAQLKKGDIVVYESTVYPGATEEKCVPVLEQESGLKCGEDFFIGYSPERINPGDKEHTFTKITKVVSGQNAEVLDIVAEVYGSVVEAGVYKVSSIKVAEAAKVIENTQRDLNIALVNELALIFNKLNIDTMEVLKAAGTKWNFLPFTPGLVGGHCIGVDPFYLTHKADIIGLHPQVILAGRRVNDNMGKYIAEQTIKQLIHLGCSVKNTKIGILGLTFKENCPDVRNTRVIDIYNELKEYGVNVLVHDPVADVTVAKNKYNVDLCEWNNLTELDAIILAVPHKEFLQQDLEQFVSKLNSTKLVVDVKSKLDANQLTKLGIKVWRL